MEILGSPRVPQLCRTGQSDRFGITSWAVRTHEHPGSFALPSIRQSILISLAQFSIFVYVAPPRPGYSATLSGRACGGARDAFNCCSSPRSRAVRDALNCCAAQQSAMARQSEHFSIFKETRYLDTTCFLFKHHGPKCLEAAAAIKPQQQVEGIARMQASRN